jgi:hypothetical protein
VHRADDHANDVPGGVGLAEMPIDHWPDAIEGRADLTIGSALDI